jgi:transcriptional regulator with XRE-family HTH domain
MDLTDFDKCDYIKRIQMLRRLHGMNQTEFAAFIGVPYKKWNHYERGYPVSRETAFILRRKITAFKFSTDWLWHGDTRGLAPGTLAQLQAFEKQDRKAQLAQTKPRRHAAPLRKKKTA